MKIAKITNNKIIITKKKHHRLVYPFITSQIIIDQTKEKPFQTVLSDWSHTCHLSKTTQVDNREEMNIAEVPSVLKL